MSSPNARRSRRVRRTRTTQATDADPVPIVTVEDDSSCIDLTHEVDEDVVDLTAVNETPVMVLGSDTPVVPAHRAAKRRRQVLEPRQILAPSSHNQSVTELPGTAPTQSADQLQPGSDDWELPDIPSVFDKPPPPSSTTRAELKTGKKRATSPVKKISCPVCLDDLNQFQENKRQLVSTICGHLFCSSCIKESIRAQHCCPTCRKKLSLKQFHPIFL